MNMIEQNRLPFKCTAPRGFRLHKLEVFNWGTFDGQVYTVRPNGDSSLLVGQNGSGKSTLVDALLTLLVKPGVRNFNVAAGAKKRERDERTYIRGAYDRGGVEEGQGTEIKYLRPKPNTFSVILAYFLNQDTAKSFTVAQFLYLKSDLTYEKIHCFAEGERSIQLDFAGIATTEGVTKILRDRGYRTTSSFSDFDGWFSKATHVKPKAMEVFNQTVAVKDIKCLNDFIRDHMLERRDWNVNVEHLLGHFQQLSEAHTSLVRTRQKSELLAPVAQLGENFQQRSAALRHAERLSAAMDGFFAQKTLAIFTPAITEKVAELERIRTRKDDLARKHREALEAATQLRDAIHREGGERLREIPHLIEREKDREMAKRTTHAKFLSGMQQLGMGTELERVEQHDFQQAKISLPQLRAKIAEQLLRLREEEERLMLDRADARRELDGLRAEFKSLEQRRENIPEWCVSLRAAICSDLGLPAKELPFAAELMQVAASEREWEASIEKVLHGFALSWLIPERYYHVVATYVERHRLAVQGQGQRLVYLRVSGTGAANAHGESSATSLAQKLKFREGHALLPWVKGEVLSRFDYICCDTIEEFQQCRSAALTRNRHIKSGNQSRFARKAFQLEAAQHRCRG